MKAAADNEKVIAQIATAFADVKFPDDHFLRGSDLGTEPYLLEAEFRGRDDWRILDPKFLDQAPDGFGSALSFFSDQAFHFYLPAYLIADIRGLLRKSDPVFSLTHSFERSRRKEPVNPRIYGEQTWFDYACQRFAGFNGEESAAIIAYLILKRKLNKFDREAINQALNIYWRLKAKGISVPHRPSQASHQPFQGS